MQKVPDEHIEGRQGEFGGVFPGAPSLALLREGGGRGREGDGDRDETDYRDEYDGSGEEEDYAYYDEEAEEDVITEVFKEFDDLSETDRVLLKLIKRLTRRISS